MTVENDDVKFIVTPSSGGLVALTVINDNGYPQVGYSGIFAYDTGPTPVLNSLAATDKVENHGTAVLNGSTSQSGRIGISAVNGGLYLENRIPQSREISLTFLC